MNKRGVSEILESCFVSLVSPVWATTQINFPYKKEGLPNWFFFKCIYQKIAKTLLIPKPYKQPSWFLQWCIQIDWCFWCSWVCQAETDNLSMPFNYRKLCGYTFVDIMKPIQFDFLPLLSICKHIVIQPCQEEVRLSSFIKTIEYTSICGKRRF